MRNNLVPVYTDHRGREFRLVQKDGSWWLCRKDGRGWSKVEDWGPSEHKAEQRMTDYVYDKALHEDLCPEEYL